MLVGVTVQAVRDRLRDGRRLASVPRGFWGMTLGHVGIAVFAVGVTLTSLYSTEKDIRLAPGETYDLAGYHFAFHGVTGREGPNYHADRGHVTVTHEDELVAEMWPEKRVYRAQPMPMTEAAIDAGVTRDLFVALGEPLGADGAWALRIYHKPFVRWIWFGGVLMVLGGLVSATDRRYRVQASREAALAKGAVGVAS